MTRVRKIKDWLKLARPTLDQGFTILEEYMNEGTGKTIIRSVKRTKDRYEFRRYQCVFSVSYRYWAIIDSFDYNLREVTLDFDNKTLKKLVVSINDIDTVCL